MTMQTMPKLQITIRDVNDSPVIRHHINKQFAKLFRHAPAIQSCKVVIGAEQKHRHKGKIFSVSIDAILPGQEVASKKRDMNLYVAIRDAFMALENHITRFSKRNVIEIDHYRSHRRQMKMHGNHPDLPNAS